MLIRNLHRLNVFEKGVLRKKFRSKTKKQQEAGGNSIIRDFVLLTPHQIVKDIFALGQAMVVQRGMQV
jgi:hypothetical protein